MFKRFLALTILAFTFALCGKAAQLPLKFVIVVASYNNEPFAEGNLLSLLTQIQDYPGQVRILITNDASKDRTSEIMHRLVESRTWDIPVTIIDNPVRMGAIYNYYTMIHSCDPHEIVLTVDGDDQLAHNGVIKYLNAVYSDPTRDIWMTYGQFKEMKSGALGWCRPIPQNFVDRVAFNEFPDLASHLRSFYAGLFQKIAKEDFFYEGKWADMTWDVPIMIRCLEMSAKGHFHFVPHVLYLYNDQNPISDHRISQQRQFMINRHFRMRKPYAPLEKLFE